MFCMVHINCLDIDSVHCQKGREFSLLTWVVWKLDSWTKLIIHVTLTGNQAEK